MNPRAPIRLTLRRRNLTPVVLEFDPRQDPFEIIERLELEFFREEAAEDGRLVDSGN